MLDRCRFVVSSADDLRDVADASVDVVTTRSVLIYVARKERALAEFFRVLRPGGRVSIGEPINRFNFPEPAGRFLGFAATPVRGIVDKLTAYHDREVRPRNLPMLDFDERDLVAIAERTGFGEIHLDLQARIAPTAPDTWEHFVNSAPNPLAPSLADMMAAALSPPERDRIISYLKPLVESGAGVERRAFAFLMGC